MKKCHFLVCLSLLLPLIAQAVPKGFVDPSDFKGTDEEKNAVIQYIQDRVKSDLKKVSMDNNSTLRMMENANLESFKSLINVEDKKILTDVIDTYCHKIDMCNYRTLEMMYKKELEASKKNLSW